MVVSLTIGGFCYSLRALQGCTTLGQDGRAGRGAGSLMVSTAAPPYPIVQISPVRPSRTRLTAALCRDVCGLGRASSIPMGLRKPIHNHGDRCHLIARTSGRMALTRHERSEVDAAPTGENAGQGKVWATLNHHPGRVCAGANFPEAALVPATGLKV